ncbi:MAG TPA: bi-domain-containing oxidoreductase [Pseudolabrys sp.]|nr:bi-domain-containing oxidoreductase [Pseudolabrys sp.]
MKVSSSCISTGTELSGVKSSNLPLWKRALRRPDQVRQVIEMVRTQGFARTKETVRSHLNLASPMGYSLSGTVVAVGTGVDDVFIGDRVACAGGQAAFHAEYVCVPRNLTVPVPEGVADDAASTVTLGAIALQGVRRAEPTVGETFVVVGLGILGQLTARILKASGIQTIGADLSPERIEQARAHGLDLAIATDGNEPEQQVARLTGGLGADAVIVTAASASADLLNAALRMCRRKGRVVLVGDVPINIDRADIYAKEIDFRISTSYGPGRYDRNYEEGGVDYPVGYVRWTENRNMQAYLGLLANGAVKIDDLVATRYPITEAAVAYAALQATEARPLNVILTYPDAAPAEPVRRVENPTVRGGHQGAVHLAVIGAGGFAKSTLLPILRSVSERFTLSCICARQGHSAASAAREFGAGYASTDFTTVLADPAIDAVMIATRHDKHAEMALAALHAGKHVFVEKPLCLNSTELASIADFYAGGEQGKPLLMTGFNRRFSPYARVIAQKTASRTNPLMMNYRVNAGYFPPDTWVHGAEGGGRNIGEACHFYDLFVMLAGAKAVSVQAATIRPQTAYYSKRDNFVAIVTFADGSVANLTYTALGSPEFPKEQLDVFVDGNVYSIDDFKDLSAKGAKAAKLTGAAAGKGHRDELIAFADAIKNGGGWPIPLWQQVEAMRIAFDVEAAITQAGS